MTTKQLTAIIFSGLLMISCNSATPRMVDCWDGCNDEPKSETVIIEVPTDQDLFDIDSLIKVENDYRLSLGQSILSKGLSCSLTTISGGSRIQPSIPGHNTLTGITSFASYTYIGEFNQPDSNVSSGMNVIPMPIRSSFQNMYLLRCTGKIVITKTDYYSFSLRSDDASLLYLNGTKVIDNDNNHAPVTVSTVRLLKLGVHDIRIDYAQAGGGSQALQLFMNNLILSREILFH